MKKRDKNKDKFRMTDKEYEAFSFMDKELANSTLSFLNYLSEIFESEEV